MRWFLALIVTAFFTALVTNYVTIFFAERQNRVKELDGATEEFTNLLGKRIDAARVLALVLGQSDDREEIRSGKLVYNQALADWNNRRAAYVAAAKKAMPIDHGKDFEHLFNRRLVNCMLKPMDTFLTGLHRCRMDARPPSKKTCQTAIMAKVKLPEKNNCPALEFPMQAITAKAENCRDGLRDYLQTAGQANEREEGLIGRIVRIWEGGQNAKDAQQTLGARRAAAIGNCTFGAEDPSFRAAIDQGFVEDPEFQVLPTDTTEEPGTEDDGVPVENLAREPN
jgi:hypothetical protein